MAYWDDFFRHPKRRKDRQCIRPEVSRTKHIGVVGGASKGFLKQKLGRKVGDVELAREAVSFTSLDLSYLLGDNYEKRHKAIVEIAHEVHDYQLELYTKVAGDKLQGESERLAEMTGLESLYPVKIVYSSLPHFQRLASHYGLMDDHKAGVPRTAYKGVVQFQYQDEGQYKLLVLLVPFLDFYTRCTDSSPCEDNFISIPHEEDLGVLA